MVLLDSKKQPRMPWSSAEKTNLQGSKLPEASTSSSGHGRHHGFQPQTNSRQMTPIQRQWIQRVRSDW